MLSGFPWLNEVLFSPKDEGLWVELVNQHLIMSSISPIISGWSAAWFLNSSRDGRSPLGIRNRTVLESASRAGGRL